MRTRHIHLLAAVVALIAGLLTTAPAAAVPGRETPTTHNAVSDSFSDTFADPSVIHAKDGWWYAYSTADPLRSGDPSGVMHIARTRDWSDWEYLGTVFEEANRPAWAEPTAGLWAPDIRYVDGKYVLYYTVTDTTLDPTTAGDSAVGVATADSPTGPWVPGDTPVVAPRKNVTDYFWTIDPAAFTDVDGTRYLYWGSYYGGLFVTELSADGLTAVGEPTRVAVDNRYEGSYVVRHDGWYYLMASAANCCAGPTTGYAVFAGRARTPLGPFLDAEGTSMSATRVGGTPVLTQNGNRFVGVGHHAVATDTTSRDFIVYHGIDREQPWLTEPFGINRRPMLIDRIDWIDGWPTVRAGAGPSDTDQPAPVRTSLLGIAPDDPAAGGLHGLRRGPDDAQSGRTGLVRGAAITSRLPAGDLRIRMDLRDEAPLVVRLGALTGATVLVDPGRGRLTVQAGRGRPTSVPLAARPGWRTLTVTLDGGRMTAAMSESDLGDPFAEASTAAPRSVSGPLALLGRDARVDNVSVQRFARQASRVVDVPQAGKTLWSNDFSTGTDGLDWVRRDPAASVTSGALNWPVQPDDLVGTANTAGLLLRDAPAGDWIAETKLHLDLGGDEIRNFQQAGLIVHAGDDDFARLGLVSIWNTRQTEWGRESTGAPDGRLSYGGANIGTAADTLWLRVAHHENPAGDHLYRAASSRDGRHWTWGAVWTFDAGTTPRIGLYSHGGATPAATARFDYLRLTRGTWPADRGRG